jgi:asparagine synthase (glutamine-hydrolysing)
MVHGVGGRTKDRERTEGVSGLLAVLGGVGGLPRAEMIRELEELGPDGTGEWHAPSGGAWLARAQLFNTAHSRREEPVVVRGDVAVIFDGRLVARSPAERRTDSEILLDAYDAWGLDCVPHLQGEFAFVIWDGARQRLFAACDVLGMRTLAYHASGATLSLCSRALTLLWNPTVPRTWDEVYLASTLCGLWAQPPGSTPFAHIRRLRPGWAILFEAGRTKLFRADELDAGGSPEIRGIAAYDQFLAVFDASVSDRLSSDVPTCTTLSGGLDSACVLASALRKVGAIDAYSMVFAGKAGKGERELIQACLDHFSGVHWHPVDCTGLDDLTESVSALAPCDDPLVPDVAFVAARGRLDAAMGSAGFRIALDGDGGDELFEVWNRFGDLLREGQLSGALRWLLSRPSPARAMWHAVVLPNLPRVLARLGARRGGDRVPPWMTQAFRSAGALEQALEEGARLQKLWTMRAAVPALLEIGGFTARVHAKRLLAARARIEHASPFLDRRVVEFVLRLPSGLRAHPFPKMFLRRANESRLPESVVARPKDNTSYLEVERRGLERAEAAIERLANAGPPLDGWVERARLREAVRGLRSEHVDDTRTSQLHAVLGLADWTSRAFPRRTVAA